MNWQQDSSRPFCLLRDDAKLMAALAQCGVSAEVMRRGGSPVQQLTYFLQRLGFLRTTSVFGSPFRFRWDVLGPWCHDLWDWSLHYYRETILWAIAHVDENVAIFLDRIAQLRVVPEDWNCETALAEMVGGKENFWLQCLVTMDFLVDRSRKRSVYEDMPVWIQRQFSEPQLRRAFEKLEEILGPYS